MSAYLGLDKRAVATLSRFRLLRTLSESGHTPTAERIGQGQATHPTKGRSGRDQAGDRQRCVSVFTTLARVTQLRLEALSYSLLGITHTHTHTRTLPTVASRS